jgi:16S rRNA U516 pseudouridylate synthase RsuA-like enzyme
MKVRRLQRVAIGPLTLKGLAVGQWRVLSSAEVRSLRKAAGLA